MHSSTTGPVTLFWGHNPRLWGHISRLGGGTSTDLEGARLRNFTPGAGAD